MANEQEKLEKQNKKLKKKNKSKGKIILLLLLILILIAALVIFLDKLAGLFGGNLSGIFFKDNGNKEGTPSAATSVSETAAPDNNGSSDNGTEAQSKKTELRVTIVSGSTYTMDGSTVTVDNIVEKVKSAGAGNVEVIIVEDSATTDDAVSILIDALTGAGLDPNYDIKEEKA